MHTTATTASNPLKKAKPKAELKAEAVEPEAPSYECAFCKKAYRRENAFLVHMCEQKQRFLNKDEKHVKLAFKVYSTFYQINYRGQKARTYDDFAKSKFYTAFVKFGRYLLDINAVNPDRFVEFLIKTGIPLDRWQSPVVYETYMRELAKKETALAAIERNFLLMQQWEREAEGRVWTNFFREVSPVLATHWIRHGRISPWVLYTASSANDLFSRMSEEQINLITQAVEPKFWQAKFASDPETVGVIREILDEAGI